METASPRLRISILGIVALSLFGALFARLWYLQVMASPQFEVQAQANRVREVTEKAPRGRILDAKGRVLVDNRTSLVVAINPHDLQSVDDRGELLSRLAHVLTQSGVPTKVSSIERHLADRQFNPLQAIPVAVDVPEELFLYLAERSDEFPSVEVRRETVRTYPYGAFAGNVLGYVGRISEEEYAARDGYEPDSDIGKSGIEKSFEEQLRGVRGVRTIEIDSQNRPVRTTEYFPPQQGYDIQLTIDIDVQMAAEKALAEQLESLRGRFQRDGALMKAPAGSVVVMDPRNGDVIAMASYPSYNPEEFVNGISTERYQELVAGSDADPLTNRTIQGLYAPGSTFKPITAIAALDAGMITEYSSYLDPGYYDVGTLRVYNAGKRPYGAVDVRRSLTVSSDVYYYWLGDKFWRDTYGDGMQQTARAFGLGAITGIDLPGEAAGLVPDPDVKAKRHEENPEAFPEGKWYSGDNVNVAIGQGDVLVTPLQLASVYATIANGGTVYRPRITTGVEPEVTGSVELPASTVQPVLDGLTGVITSREGTAYLPFQGFDMTGFQVAGKTGTAQVNGKADTSLFASFAPSGNALYSVVAVLEESGFGSDAAVPVVRRVYEAITGQTQTLPGETLTGAGVD